MRSALITGAGLALHLAVALTLSSRGDQDDRRPLTPATLEPVAVQTLIDTPEPYYRQPLRVDGTVTAVGRAGRFAVTGPRATILVQPEKDAGVREGDRVRVYGVLNYLDRVTRIGRLGDARTDAGAPFVAANGVRPA